MQLKIKERTDIIGVKEVIHQSGVKIPWPDLILDFEHPIRDDETKNDNLDYHHRLGVEATGIDITRLCQIVSGVWHLILLNKRR